MHVRMITLVLAFLSVAVCAATTGASADASGMIAFSTNRAESLYRVGIYSIRPDGKKRRLLSLPTPPASTVIRSPGGRRILFEHTTDGRSALFAADLSGANAARLTPPDLQPDLQYGGAAFSPDGRKIAFTSFESCGYRCSIYTIWMVDPDGSDLHLLSDFARQPSWAPDSRRLAYAGRQGIAVSDSGGENKAIVGPRGYRPVWAPRGNRIAYNLASGGYGVVCFVDAVGSHRQCLPGHSAKRPLWSPDATRVAFEQVNPTRLGVVNADGGGLRYLERNGRARGSGVRFPAAWSPNGRRLAFVDRYSRKIFTRNVFGRPESRQVTHEPNMTLSDVRWHAGRISYAAYLLTNDFELASMNTDGSNVRILTHNSDDDIEPDWSPDGQTIVFSRRSGRFSILRLINADGSYDRSLTAMGHWRDGSPSWSPDGRRIAFVRVATGPYFRLLMTVNADGSEPTIISTLFVNDRISWSPDGRSIVVSAGLGGGNSQLFVVDVAGGPYRQIATDQGAEAPAWSPDGTKILFAGYGASPPSKTGWDLFTIRPDGTGLKHLVGDAASSSHESTWSPDGSQIAFTRDVTGSQYPQRSSIAVIGAGGQGLRELTDNYSSNVDPAWSR